MEPKPARKGAEKAEKDGMTGRERWSEDQRKRAGWMVVKLCDELTGSLIGKQNSLDFIIPVILRLFFLGLEFLQQPLPSYITGARGEETEQVEPFLEVQCPGT